MFRSLRTFMVSWQLTNYKRLNKMISGSTGALNAIPPEASTPNPLTLSTGSDVPRYPSPQNLNSSGSSYLPNSQINGPLSVGSNTPTSNSKTRARRSRSTVKDSDEDECRSNDDKEQERRNANNTRER